VTKLTVREESVCKDLQDRGYDYLSQSMREHYSREHEVFEELKHVDVDTLYGPRVKDVMRNALKQAIADGDHAVVRSMHSLFLSMDETKKQAVTESEPFSFGTAALGLGLLVFSVLAFLITVGLGL
jgi:hypothetical protein